MKSFAVSLAVITLSLGAAACGQTIEQKAATGAVAGAVVAGPVGAAVGGAAVGASANLSPFVPSATVLYLIAGAALGVVGTFMFVPKARRWLGTAVRPRLKEVAADLVELG